MSQVAAGPVTNYLQTNDVSLSFSGGLAGYTLNAPTNTTHLSAKTAWNLRRRQAVSFSGGAATNHFTGTNFLKCGDVVTVDGSTSITNTDNQVKLDDYNKVVFYFLQSGDSGSQVGRADLTGDGQVKLDDYNKVVENFLQSGDPQ
jgi:hypothetical protein